MITAVAIRAGDFVSYIDWAGRCKPALVIGDPESVGSNDVVPMLETGELHLKVFSPTGSVYTRRSVMFNADRKPGEAAESGTGRERSA